MKTMQRIAWAFSLGALLLVWALTGVSAAAGPNDGDPDPEAILGVETRGVVFFTAAINSNGTIRSCFECNPSGTVRLGVGEYQVNFFVDVEAINGWSRWVQPDTLTDGSLNAWCTTANRFGLTTAIYVQCQGPGGPGSMGNSKPVDTSFFLFVAR